MTRRAFNVTFVCQDKECGLGCKLTLPMSLPNEDDEINDRPYPCLLGILHDDVSFKVWDVKEVLPDIWSTEIRFVAEDTGEAEEIQQRLDDLLDDLLPRERRRQHSVVGCWLDEADKEREWDMYKAWGG